jgi:hypothetical protein
MFRFWFALAGSPGGDHTVIFQRQIFPIPPRAADRTSGQRVCFQLLHRQARGTITGRPSQSSESGERWQEQRDGPHKHQTPSSREAPERRKRQTSITEVHRSQFGISTLGVSLELQVDLRILSCLACRPKLPSEGRSMVFGVYAFYPPIYPSQHPSHPSQSPDGSF